MCSCREHQNLQKLRRIFLQRVKLLRILHPTKTSFANEVTKIYSQDVKPSTKISFFTRIMNIGARSQCFKVYLNPFCRNAALKTGQ